MRSSCLYASIVVVGLGLASGCGEDSPVRPRDSGSETRPADGGTGSDARDTGTADVVRPPDSPGSDASVTPDMNMVDAPVGVDAAVDRALDSAVDASVDQAPPADAGADVTADTGSDTSVDVTPDTTSDTADAMADLMADSGGDGPAVLNINDCLPQIYVNRTATGADRNLTWNQTIATEAERCMIIRVGQSVTWTGSLSSHPLAAQAGTMPTPITGDDDGGSVTYTFSTPGTYGYVCTVHPAMKGAIYVVP